MFDISITQYEQIPIILGVWPFWLLLSFSVNNILAGLWLNQDEGKREREILRERVDKERERVESEWVSESKSESESVSEWVYILGFLSRCPFSSVYTGISLAIDNLYGNIYVNTMITAALEIPAYFLTEPVLRFGITRGLFLGTSLLVVLFMAQMPLDSGMNPVAWLRYDIWTQNIHSCFKWFFKQRFITYFMYFCFEWYISWLLFYMQFSKPIYQANRYFSEAYCIKSRYNC